MKYKNKTSIRNKTNYLYNRADGWMFRAKASPALKYPYTPPQTPPYSLG